MSSSRDQLLEQLARFGHRVLPMPGAGLTRERFAALWEAGQRAPAVGRLVEAHLDAVAILHEAGHAVPADATIGVWAADGPDPLHLVRAPNDGPARLIGAKHWCSGASLVSHALVTARVERVAGDASSAVVGVQHALVLVDLAAEGVEPGESSWQSQAFAEIDTRTMRFDTPVADDQVVGPQPDWYLTRPGFWHGAVGVAACWAGCVAGLVDEVQAGWRRDPHALAHRGAIDATLWGLGAALNQAADEIDAAPLDAEAAHARALRVRLLVDAGVGDVMARLGRALGPHPMAFVDGYHQRLAETDLYRRQSHAEHDLEQLGLLVATRPTELAD